MLKHAHFSLIRISIFNMLEDWFKQKSAEKLIFFLHSKVVFSDLMLWCVFTVFLSFFGKNVEFFQNQNLLKLCTKNLKFRFIKKCHFQHCEWRLKVFYLPSLVRSHWKFNVWNSNPWCKASNTLGSEKSMTVNLISSGRIWHDKHF